MDLSTIINESLSSVSGWFAVHGTRVLLVVLVAIAANIFVRATLSRRRIAPILDNIPRPKYKNIIGQAERRRIETIIKTLKHTLTFAISVVAIVTIMPEFGINVGPIIAGMGLVGVAAGLAAKDLLTDYIGGFFIIIEGEFSIGDKVKIGGGPGKGREVSLRRTILEGKNGAVHIVPNREIKLIKRFAGRKKTVEKEPSKDNKENQKQKI